MGESISVINPATGQLIQEIPSHDPAAVEDRVAIAREAQPAWAATTLSHRMDCIRDFRELLLQRVETLAPILTAETGKPMSQARNEILATAQRIDFFLEHVEQVLAQQIVYSEPAPSTEVAPLEEVITQDPLGVIANISAWNYPYFVGSNVFIPALLTGNAVLYKPSEIATMTGIAIASLLHEAGIPEAIFTPILGAGATGSALLKQQLDGLFFTGSYGTGQKIAGAAASQLIPVQLELGGKDPAYVCNDVDVAAAAASLADGAFYNNGQSCCAVERIYVQAGIYDAFVETFVSLVQSFRLGDPTEAETYLGPLSRQAQLTLLAEQVADALAQGAKLQCGGQQLERPGWYFAPTVFSDVNHDMTLMQEETFGPVIGIQRVETDEMAIALMNDTDYGLTAAVYSADRERAMQILSQVKTGTAYWNCCDRVSPRLPWSGRGHSGLGSTLSQTGIQAFLQPKAWHLRGTTC
jgi:acyl-CoA reductase-like NAD-dependent aldehyde dehydrogenase